MESDLEKQHEIAQTEPVLEVVEGDAKDDSSEHSIVPNAFESVLEKVDEERKYVETEAPPYKNRAFIGIVCLVVGIIAGRLTTQPKIEKVVVEKEKPIAAVTPPASEPVKTPDVPKVDKPFREFLNLGEFDPWQPMNGGFPLPPKDTQAKIVGRSGSPVPNGGGEIPTGLSGHITPMDPGEIGGPLPNLNGGELPAATGDTANEADKGNSGKATTPAQTSGQERYVSISMNGPEPTKGQASIEGMASALGGTSRTFTHMAEDGTVEAQCILVIIPAAKFNDAKAKIEALGGASVDATFEGNASDQQNRIQSPYITRLAKLRDKRKDLLVDFLDDAPVVKQINEAIDFETRAVSATRLPSGLAGKAVIQVRLK